MEVGDANALPRVRLKAWSYVAHAHNQVYHTNTFGCTIAQLIYTAFSKKLREQV